MVLGIGFLLVILGFFVVMPMISLRFVDQLGWAAGVVGLALGLRQLTQQGLGVFGGSLADKFGAPLIVCGMLLRALGFCQPSLCPERIGTDPLLHHLGAGWLPVRSPRRPGDQVHPATGAGSLHLPADDAGERRRRGGSPARQLAAQLRF